MTIHNQNVNLACLSCCKTGKSLVKDTFFEGKTLMVLIVCECGGVSRYEYKAFGGRWISGDKRKKLYQNKENTLLIVKAKSVEDYLNKYYKKSRMTPTLLESYEKEFKQYGYVCTSHHDNVTGEFIAWPTYPGEEKEEEENS